MLTEFQVPSSPCPTATPNAVRYDCSEPIRSMWAATNILTTKVLFATGDVLAQQMVEGVGAKKHNLARTGRMALYGGGKL